MFQVRGILNLTGSSPFYSPLAITVTHECTGATAASSATGHTFSYTILNPASTETLQSFTISQPTG